MSELEKTVNNLEVIVDLIKRKSKDVHCNFAHPSTNNKQILCGKSEKNEKTGENGLLENFEADSKAKKLDLNNKDKDDKWANVK